MRVYHKSCGGSHVFDAVPTALINFPRYPDIDEEVFTGSAQPIAHAQRRVMERY